MSDVALLHTSGGLLGDVFTDGLRVEEPGPGNRVLADPATFTGPDGRSPRRAQYEADLDAAYQTGSALWTAYAEELAGGMEVSRLRERLLIPFLRSMGFDPQYQRSRLRAGEQPWAISHLGWPDDPDAAPLLLVADTDLDDRAGRACSPHEELQGYLNSSPARWGALSNGRTLRILRDYHHTRTRGFVEVDLVGVFDAASRPDFLALYRLLHVSRYRLLAAPAGGPGSTGEEDDEEAGDATAAPDGDRGPVCLLERAYEANLDAGIAAGKRLQPQVRAAIEALANGLADATPGLRAAIGADPDRGRDLYREILTVLYRTLFLLLAEQRGMLTGADPLYEQTYSLTALRARVEAGDYEPRRQDLWAGLVTTFSLFADADRAASLGVYPYNGALFDPDRTPLTGGGRCGNTAVAAAVRALTTVQVGGLRMHVDYRNLGVEELGTVYESLLDYTLAIAAGHTAVPGQKRTVGPGRIYLAPLSAERGDMGAYYTPAALVDLLLSRSLDPLIDTTRRAAGDDPAAQAEALLRLRILDPACGSAAILVGALDRVADAVARARSAPREPLDSDLAPARRDVLARCIYGIDKDPFAVELAKVALWIHCVVPDQPLSFLDSRIVCGDALVGWPLLDVPATIPSEAYSFGKAGKADKPLLGGARTRNEAFLDAAGREGVLFGIVADPDLALPPELSAPDTSYDAVRDKAAAFQRWRQSPDYRRWKAAADLWTAAFFWSNDDAPGAPVRPPTSADYQQAITGRPDPALAAHAQALLADLDPLHWPLAFPDVRAAGGFDIILGNPPWEQYKGEEEPFFAQAAPGIAAMTSEHRKQAIDALAGTDPDLHRRWLRYRAGQDRLSHYAKTCGRYTRTSNETNTYVLFTELAADHARNAGIIVKTGIATDAAQSPVWRRLTAAGRVAEIRDMVNSSPGGGLVFPAVAAVERFATLALAPVDPHRPVRAAMLNFGVEQAADAVPRAWSRADLAAVAPRTGTLLSSRSTAELDLAVALQQRFPTLDFAEPDGANPWGISYHTLFHSTKVKTDGLALRAEALRAQGYTLGRDKVFRHPDGRRAVPILEGQMVNRWDHRARTYEGYTGPSKYGRKPHIPWVSDEQHADPGFETEPRYWMPATEAARRIHAVAGDKWLLAMRSIGWPASNRRTMRSALVGRLPATHSLPVLALGPGYVFAALALLNSMTFDFLMRLHMSGPNIVPWIASQCAAPGPDDVPRRAAELAAGLSVTSRRLADLTGAPAVRWDPAQRAEWDAEIDVLIARAYGLGIDEFSLVMDHFTLLARVETKQLGEYRSKRLRLQAWDRTGGGA